MLIEYVTNGSKREVGEAIGNLLVARKIARPVYKTREMAPEAVADTPEPEVSERTGKPKRRYKRRDMSPEE